MRRLTGRTVLPVTYILLSRPVTFAFHLKLGRDFSDNYGLELLPVGRGYAVLEACGSTRPFDHMV